MTTVTFEDFDDDDTEKELINCPTCHTELFMLEHSVFENGYYLYCDSCPLRVDVSIYDEKYTEIEERLKREIKDWDDNEDALDILLSEIEKHLQACSCGGHFKDNAPRRCLHCGEKLEGYKNYMNVWYLRHFDNDCENDEISKHVIEPKWL